MCAAAYAHVLYVVLALTSTPSRCQHDQAHTENEAKPLCKDSPRNLLVYGPDWEMLYDSGMNKGQNKVSIEYGTEVKVQCSGKHSKNLALSRNDMKLITDESPYGIIWYTSKLDLQQSEYVFTCNDFKTTCELSVIILVTPGFEVMSPNIGNCFCRNQTYTVYYGNPVSVLCSGPDAARLVMTKDRKTLPTKRKNDTTIESFERTPDLQISEYVCTDVASVSTGSVIIKVMPKVYFQSRNKMITPYVMYLNCDDCVTPVVQKYYLKYNGSIEVLCSGPRAVKFMGQDEDDNTLLTKNINENTAFINITKLGISKYTCGDSEFSKYVRRVQVKVIPLMEVVSPGVRIPSTGSMPIYSVTYEHPLEISCSGPDASRLTIVYYPGGIEYREETVNKNTLKHIINKPVWDESMLFICSEQGMSEGANVAIRVLPAVIDFRCVSFDLQLVNCTWTAINNDHINTLFIVDNGILTQICEKPAISKRSSFCTYENDNERRYSKVLTFIMRSCCDDGCYNQTFQFNHLSVVKLGPPEGLKVLRTTSRGAALQWDVDVLHFGDIILTANNGDVHHKVQYWYFGIEPRNVNSSLVTCRYVHCKIELNLPCSEQFYEVKIYRKLNTAVGEQYWSDPSSLGIYTDSENDNKNNVDPTCYKKPQKTKEVMTFLVQDLREKMGPAIQLTRQKLRSLQNKLANIRKYKASTKEQDRQ